MDASFRQIAFLFPGCHFRRYQRLGVQPPVQALAIHEIDLRFGPIQPTAVLGGVMKFNLIQDPARLGWGEGLVQARPVMRVQVILDQADLLGLGVMPVHQIPDAFSLVTPSAACGHLDVPPAPQGVTPQQLVTNAFALILILNPGRTAGARPLCRADLAEQVLTRFIEAHNGGAWIVRPQVSLNHVFHAPDVLRIRRGRDTPGLDDPRFDVIFFNACHTVTVLRVSTKPNTTSSSTSSCTVQ